MQQLEPKVPSQSETIMTELVLPQHTNELGTVFGGMVMSWVDIAAAICAQRHAGKQVVTASVDAMQFRAPVRLGWILKLYARVNNVWKSSCEVGVKVMAENPKSGEIFHTASAYVTMVALDGMGRPTTMRSLLVENQEDKRRFEDAEARKTARLALKKQQGAK